MADREETLRRLTLGDEAYLDALLDERQPAPGHAGPRTRWARRS